MVYQFPGEKKGLVGVDFNEAGWRFLHIRIEELKKQAKS